MGTVYPLAGIVPAVTFAVILYAPLLAWWLARQDRKRTDAA